MEHNKADTEKESKLQVLMVPVVVVNGVVSGIISVITAYFFKPLWLKITGLWTNERKIN